MGIGAGALILVWVPLCSQFCLCSTNFGPLLASNLGACHTTIFVQCLFVFCFALNQLADKRQWHRYRSASWSWRWLELLVLCCVRQDWKIRGRSLPPFVPLSTIVNFNQDCQHPAVIWHLQNCSCMYFLNNFTKNIFKKNYSCHCVSCVPWKQVKWG